MCSRTLALGLALLESAPAALAQPNADAKRACLAAADSAQTLRIEGKLSAAREQLARCSRDDCPTVVQKDCSAWMVEVVAALPSVVVAARDAKGKDLVAVRLFVDGQLVASELDGKPLPVDPGAHVVRLEPATGEPFEEKVLVRAGEKNRPLTFTLGGPAPSPTDPAPEVTPRAKPSPERVPPATQSVPALTWAFGGLGVAALGTALYFDLSANAEVVNLRETCAPRCAESKVDAVRTQYTIAGVAAGVGVASLGVATYLFLSSGSGEKPTSGLAIMPEARGGRASVWLAF